MLDRDPNADYRILESPDDQVTYTGNIIRLNTLVIGLEVFSNINSLVVESPFDLRQYFRIAPRSIAGFGEFYGPIICVFITLFVLSCNAAQLVVSGNEAFMVQFGVNPNVRNHHIFCKCIFMDPVILAVFLHV